MESAKLLQEVYAKELTRSEKFKKDAYQYKPIRAYLEMGEKQFKLMKRAARQMVMSEAMFKRSGLVHQKRLAKYREFLSEKVLEFIDTWLPDEGIIKTTSKQRQANWIYGLDKLQLGVLRLLITASANHACANKYPVDKDDSLKVFGGDNLKPFEGGRGRWKEDAASTPQSLPRAESALKRRRSTRLANNPAPTRRGTASSNASVESEPEELWQMESPTPNTPNYQAKIPTAYESIQTGQVNETRTSSPQPAPARPDSQISQLPRQWSEYSVHEMLPQSSRKSLVVKLPVRLPDGLPSCKSIPQSPQHIQQQQDTPPDQQSSAHTLQNGYDALYEGFDVQEPTIRDEKAGCNTLEAEPRDNGSSKLGAMLHAEKARGDQLEEELHDERTNRKNLEADLHNFEKKYTSLEVELRDERANLHNEKASHSQLEAELRSNRGHELETLLHAEKTKGVELEEELRHERANRKGLETDLYNYGNRNAALENELHNERTNLFNAQASYSQLEAALHNNESRKLEALLHAEKTKAVELEEELRHERANRKGLETDLYNYGNRNAALENELHDERTNLFNAQACRSQLEAKLHDTIARSGELVAELNGKNTRNEALETQLHGEKIKNKILEKQLHHEKSKSESLETRLQGEETRSETLTVQLNGEKDRSETLERQLHDEKSQSEKLEKQLNDANTRSNEMEARLQDEITKSNELQTKVHDEKANRTAPEVRPRGETESRKRRKLNKRRGRIVVTVDTIFPSSDDDSPSSPSPPGSHRSEVTSYDTL